MVQISGEATASSLITDSPNLGSELTVGQSAEVLEEEDDVAEEGEERDGPFTLVLRVVEDAGTFLVRPAHLLVAHVTHVKKEVPNVAHAVSCKTGNSPGSMCG